MSSEREPERDPLAPAAARLTARYGQLMDAEIIHRVLHETYRALLANATITNFLPILAERSAAKQLADRPDAIQSSTAIPPQTNDIATRDRQLDGGTAHGGAALA
jgi:protein-tyrosine phosphatase-like protein